MSRKEFGILTVDEEERRASQWLLWATVVTLVVALSWAAWFELDEVTKGQGKVIPASREQVVQSLDSGVVSQILVREGAVVKKDDVLIRLDDGRSGPVFREAKEKKLSGIVWQVLEWNEPAINFYKKYNSNFDPEWINCSIPV